MNNITISNLSKSYPLKGSSKSTLLKIIAAIEKPTSGTVSLGDLRLNYFSQEDYDNYRLNDIGYIFQDWNLLSGLTCISAIFLFLFYHYLVIYILKITAY